MPKKIQPPTEEEIAEQLELVNWPEGITPEDIRPILKETKIVSGIIDAVQAAYGKAIDHEDVISLLDALFAEDDE